MTVNRGSFYKHLKIVGMLSFIPFILPTGPLAGYFVGQYLEKKLNFVHYTSAITISIGLIASLSETVRIIKLVYDLNKKSSIYPSDKNA